MGEKFSFPTWERLTKAEATNFLITALIVNGFDSHNELVVDGNPGKFLEKVALELDIDWEKIFPESGTVARSKAMVPGWKICASILICKLAGEIGYKGRTVKGIIDYLRFLPDEGPIGKT